MNECDLSVQRHGAWTIAWTSEAARRFRDDAGGPVPQSRLGAKVLAISAISFSFRRPPLSWAGRRAAALAADHARRDRGPRHLACGFRRLRGLHGQLRFVQQEMGDALRRRRDADLAVADERRPAVRRRDQRGGAAAGCGTTRSRHSSCGRQEAARQPAARVNGFSGLREAV